MLEDEEWDWNKAKEQPEVLERIEELRLKNLMRDLTPPDEDGDEGDIPMDGSWLFNKILSGE